MFENKCNLFSIIILMVALMKSMGGCRKTGMQVYEEEKPRKLKICTQ